MTDNGAYSIKLTQLP